MGTPSIGLLMVVSPGEAALAGDSLRRALAFAPGPCAVSLVNNGGLDDPAGWWAGLGISGHHVHPLSPPGGQPRPYFEIGRTIFAGLAALAATPPALVFKIDPDTLVLNAGFFTDICQLETEQPADFYACLVHVSRADHLRRNLRLLADRLPLGFGRGAGRDRYGSRLRLRSGPVWYHRAARRGGLAAARQPSGGFYALRGEMIARLARQELLASEGRNGLEWNDDTLLPIAVRAAGGRICDVRASRFAPHWRWLHGSRYFSQEQAREPALRALHPVKLGPDDRALRTQLNVPAPRP